MADAAFAEDQGFTYADYKAWELKPGERFELIDGEAYAMAAPNTVHQLFVAMLTVEIGNFLRGRKCRVIPSPFDVRLFYAEDESDDTVVQPDLVVVCDPEKLGEEGCRGAPDMVVEILSPSNTAIEMERKLLLYRDAQVKEYWIVDPENRHINIYRLKDGDFVMRSSGIKDTVQSTALPGLEIALAGVFDQP